MKILVIGGVAAGTKAAAKWKRENRADQVVLLTKSADISYAGCGLPYYVGGSIENREELIVNTPQKYRGLTGVEVLTLREATHVDPAAKVVTVQNLENGQEETYSYDKLIVATGASAVKLPLPGVDLNGVFPMRAPEDAITMRDYLEANGVKKAVVIGGGFIGLELAENLFDRGISVTVVEVASQILLRRAGWGDGRLRPAPPAAEGYPGAHRHQGHGPCGRWQGGGRTDRRRPAALPARWWCPRASGPTPPFWRAPASRWKRAPLWWTNVSPPAWRTSTPPGTALW